MLFPEITPFGWVYAIIAVICTIVWCIYYWEEYGPVESFGGWVFFLLTVLSAGLMSLIWPLFAAIGIFAALGWLLTMWSKKRRAVKDANAEGRYH